MVENYDSFILHFAFNGANPLLFSFGVNAFLSEQMKMRDGIIPQSMLLSSRVRDAESISLPILMHYSNERGVCGVDVIFLFYAPITD